MADQHITIREAVIRSAVARFTAGERLRALAFVGDALEREGLRELSGAEADEVALALATGTLPYGGEAIPETAEPRHWGVGPRAGERIARAERAALLDAEADDSDEAMVADLLARGDCPRGVCD